MLKGGGGGKSLEHIWIRNSTRVCTHEVTVKGTFGSSEQGCVWVWGFFVRLAAILWFGF